MKHSDCPTVSANIVIASSAAEVWNVISDITMPTRFSTELVSVEWLGDDSSPRVGAKFVGRSQHAATGGWQTECVVTAYEPESNLTGIKALVEGDAP